jgi:hypothetical protein
MALEVETTGVFEHSHPISAPRQQSHRQPCVVSERLPPCIVGRVCSVAPYEQLELAHCPRESISDLALERLSDSLLLAQLCKTRAVFNYTTDGVLHMAVECLTPLSRMWSDPRGQEALVAQVLDSELQSPRIRVLGASLVWDILKDNAADRLSEACSRPSCRAGFSQSSQGLVPQYEAGGTCDSSECPADMAIATDRAGRTTTVGGAGARNTQMTRKLRRSQTS